MTSTNTNDSLPTPPQSPQTHNTKTDDINDNNNNSMDSAMIDDNTNNATMTNANSITKSTTKSDSSSIPNSQSVYNSSSVTINKQTIANNNNNNNTNTNTNNAPPQLSFPTYSRSNPSSSSTATTTPTTTATGATPNTSNLLHALPDLSLSTSSHHRPSSHHRSSSIHPPLNTIITNPSTAPSTTSTNHPHHHLHHPSIYGPPPPPLPPPQSATSHQNILTPIHHTHHHTHHHLVPPFMRYPGFPHPTIVHSASSTTNPYMPTIGNTSTPSTNTQTTTTTTTTTSITMPTIENNKNNNKVNKNISNHNNTSNTTTRNTNSVTTSGSNMIDDNDTTDDNLKTGSSNLVPTSSVTDTNKKLKLKQQSSSSDSSSSTSSSSSSSSSDDEDENINNIINKKKKTNNRKTKVRQIINTHNEDDDDEDDEDEDDEEDDDNNDDSDYNTESSENVKPRTKLKTKTLTRGPKKKRQVQSSNDDDDEDDEDDDDDDNSHMGNRTLTGVWVVYYTWDIIRDLDMTKPRYEMELKQHYDGTIQGNCIEGSGPAAWTFLLTGKLEKGKTFKYTMHGEDEEIFGKATFDGNNIIKNGMWYRDRLYLRKGGSLVAARKGTKLPKSLMHKTDTKKISKRKREIKNINNNNNNNMKNNYNNNDQHNLYSPPSKRQKRSHSRSVTPIKSQKSKPKTKTPPKCKMEINQNKNNNNRKLNVYKSSGPITCIDGRIVPPEPPPKPKSKQKTKLKQKQKKRRGRPPKKNMINNNNDNKNVIVIADTSHDETNNALSDSSDDIIMKNRASRRNKKNRKKIKERIKKIKQRKSNDNKQHNNKDSTDNKKFAPSIPEEYKECNLTGAWSLYFDNSVSQQQQQQNDGNNNKKNKNKNNNNNTNKNNKKIKTKTEIKTEEEEECESYLYNYYDDDDEPINNDTLFLSHNCVTNELSGFVCSPLKCHVTGNVSSNGIDVRLIMIWSPNKELGGQFAGYVTVINGEYDCDGGLNCEYCSFHCTSYFHTMLWRRFEENLPQQLKTKGLKTEITQQEKMELFQHQVKTAVDNTKYNNSDYVAIVEEWFHNNEKDVSPGQIQENKHNYSNQCIWKRRKLPYITYKHIYQQTFNRKYMKTQKYKQLQQLQKDKFNKQQQIDGKQQHGDDKKPFTKRELIIRQSVLPEFMIRHDRICKNSSPYFFGDLVQLFITLDTVLSHPLSYYDNIDNDNNDIDNELETDKLLYFGCGKWIDGIIINIYEGKVLVRYYYEKAIYQQWIDCDIDYKKRITVQPVIRLRKSSKHSSHLNHIVGQLNINSLSQWRLNLNKSSLCFACDENGEWAQAIIKRRFGCFVYIHYIDYSDKYDQYLSIHSQRIQPLNASHLPNSFRTNLKFENVLRIKPTIKPIKNEDNDENKDKKDNDNKNNNDDINNKESSNDDFDIVDKLPKTTAISNIFGATILHLKPISNL